MDEVSELKTELQDLRMQLEIEKQKNTKLQKELEIAQKKAGRRGVPTAHIPKVAPRQASRSGMHIDMGDTPVTHGELTRLEKIMGDIQGKLDSIEHEKWEVQKKNIELKENLQRLNLINLLFQFGDNLFPAFLFFLDSCKFLPCVCKLKSHFEVLIFLTVNLFRNRFNVFSEIRPLNFQAQIEKYEKVLKEEAFKHDKINGEYVKARDLLAKYEDHWLSKIYNR